MSVIAGRKGNLARMLRRVLMVGLGFGVVMVAAVAGLNLYVAAKAGKQTSDVAQVRHAQAAIVLGAGLNRNGSMSGMLADRVHQAVALYRAGKVDRILVSGDHHRWGYDEPGTMRNALQRAGVPDAAIFTDHAGFDTWATMERAVKVFGVRSAVVITQGFHMDRALYLARAAGLDATGLTADLHPYGRQGQISSVRELFARVKAVGEVVEGRHVLLGPPHPIDGDGRQTWGPAPPAGQGPPGGFATVLP
jgi:SanA protein